MKLRLLEIQRIELRIGYFDPSWIFSPLAPSSLDFADRATYERFLAELVRQRNLTRSVHFEADWAALRPLPAAPLDFTRELTVRVSRFSLVRVLLNHYSVPSRLMDTLKELTGLADLTIDADGDIVIGYGSAHVFVRLVDNPPHVRIYSRLLSEVEESHEIFARLNDINANEIFVRSVFLNGSILATVDILAAPFVSAHVTEACVHFCTIADGMDGLLQEEFGGQTAFPESMPSSMKH